MPQSVTLLNSVTDVKKAMPRYLFGKLERVFNREKSLRHVTMVAKFLDNNKPKTSLKK